MRLSEMTDEQLIKQVDDDALAREMYSRLVLARHRVSEQMQALEHQRDKYQAKFEYMERRCERILAMVRDEEDVYGIGSMCSMWTGPDMASDVAARLQQDEDKS